MHCTRVPHERCDAPTQATCTSGRARCHAGEPHDPPPRTRSRVSPPGREPARPPTPLYCPGPLMGPGRQTVCVGAMWRPRVLPDAVPRASAGGFERLMHEREGFEPRSNERRACGKRAKGPSIIRFWEARARCARGRGQGGGAKSGQGDGGSGRKFEAPAAEHAKRVRIPGERRRRGSKVRWQGPVEAGASTGARGLR